MVENGKNGIIKNKQLLAIYKTIISTTSHEHDDVSHLASFDITQCNKIIRSTLIRNSPNTNIGITTMIQKSSRQCHQNMFLPTNLNAVGACCGWSVVGFGEKRGGNDGGSLGERTGCKDSPLIIVFSFYLCVAWKSIVVMMMIIFFPAESFWSIQERGLSCLCYQIAFPSIL